MQQTIPQVMEKASRLKTAGKLNDAKFASLPSPKAFNPNASAGEILAAASQPRIDYVKSINEIWDESLSQVKSVEADYHEADRYACFLQRVLHHIEGGSPLGEILDHNIATAAKALRAAKVSGLLDTELKNLVLRCREDLNAGLSAMAEQSKFSKRYKRAITRSLMGTSRETAEVLLSQKNSTLSKSERHSLMKFKLKMDRNEPAYADAYRKTYYKGGRGGYKSSEDLPPYHFSSLRGL